MKKNGYLPITDKNMTRFNISLDDGVKMVMFALDNAWGGEIFVPKIPSYKILDVANAICENCEKRIIGIRPGEKIHEEMITTSDSLNTYDLGKYYVILPNSTKWNLNNFMKEFNAKKVPIGFNYSSGSNTEWLNVNELKIDKRKFIKFNLKWNIYLTGDKILMIQISNQSLMY